MFTMMMREPHPPRNRLWLGVCMIAVIALGLASRKFPLLGSAPGDAFWALLVFLGWAFLRPRTTTLHLALVALATAYTVEFSQLYQAPWIQGIRGTTLGHLVLGSTFIWEDLIAYAVGVGAGVLGDLKVFYTGGAR